MKYLSEQPKCVIFDLDGTLLDTSQGIYECVKYAGEKLGYPALSREVMETFVGPPLKTSFARWYGCGEVETDALVSAFREHYREGAMFRAEPYEGILELCRNLQEAGLRLAVATSKMESYAIQILEHFGFVQYFDAIHGADPQWKTGKAELIRICVGEDDPGACVMVGDTEYDAKGAQEAGVPFLAVSYGFGDPAKLRKYPCIGTVDTPAELKALMLQAKGPRGEGV